MLTTQIKEWHKNFGNEHDCRRLLADIRWPDGFSCPRCHSREASYIASRKKYQCAQCRYQVSITSGTLFHSTNLPLVKWFQAIYHTVCERKAISAVRLARLLDVSWPTARQVIAKLNIAMKQYDKRFRNGRHIQAPMLFFILLNACMVNAPLDTDDKLSKPGTYIPQKRFMKRRPVYSRQAILSQDHPESGLQKTMVNPDRP